MQIHFLVATLLNNFQSSCFTLRLLRMPENSKLSSNYMDFC